MAFITVITSTRTADADPIALLAAVRAVIPDPLLGLSYAVGTSFDPHYALSKTTEWTEEELAAVQTAIDAAPAPSVRLTAQAFVDNLPPEWRAFLPVFVKQINVLRAAAVPPLPPLTGAMLLNAFRNEAGAL
jgi:hypothetical protein